MDRLPREQLAWEAVLARCTGNSHQVLHAVSDHMLLYIVVYSQSKNICAVLVLTMLLCM